MCSSVSRARRWQLVRWQLAALALGAAVRRHLRRAAFVDERRRCDAACLRGGAADAAAPRPARSDGDCGDGGIAHGLAEAAHPRRAAATLGGAATGRGRHVCRRRGAPGAGRHGRPVRLAATGAADRGRGRSATAWSCSTSAGLLAPLLARQRVSWRWPARAPAHAPPYAVAAGLAIVLAETVAHQYWQVIPVALVPLLIAYHGLSRLAEPVRGCLPPSRGRRRPGAGHGRRRRQRDGHAVERRAGAPARLPAQRAIGNDLVAAVPAPQPHGAAAHGGRSARGSDTAIDRRASCSRSARRSRVAEVRVMPVDGGATLLWHDLTERLREDGAVRQRNEAAAGAGRRRRQRRPVGMGSAAAGVLLLRPLAGNGRPAADGRPGPPGGVAVRVHPDDARVAEGRARRAPHRHDRSPVSTSTGSATRTAAIARSVCRGVGRARPDSAPGTHRRIVDRARPSARTGSSSWPGFLDPLTGLANRTVFVEAAGPPPGRIEVAARRRTVRGALPGSRSLQGRQRQPRPSRRRRAAERRLAPARDLPAARPTSSRGSAATSSRFCSHGLTDEQQANAVAFRIQESLSAPVLDRRPRGVHHPPASASRSAARSTPAPTRSCATPTPRCITRRRAARPVTSCSTPTCTRASRDRLGLENDLRHAVTQQRLRGALPADRAARLGHVRRLRVADPLEAQRRAGFAGDLHPAGRGSSG